MSLTGRWAEAELQALAARGHLRHLEPLSSAQGPVIRIGDEQLINFSSNDYLSLASDGRLREALCDAALHAGVGSGASRLIVGDSVAHEELEERLARFMGTASSRLFNSGYAANVGILTTLTGQGDVIFSDELNHASIVDGCRQSKATVVVYPHADIDALRSLLGKHHGRRRVIVTDAVFSMDGDLAPLRELSELAKAADAALIVDEAHALGVLGGRGHGLCAELDVTPDLRMGTLGKALGCFGAFAATDEKTSQWLLNRSRSLVFSTSLPRAVCAAASAAVELVEKDESLRTRLWRNIRRLAKGLSGLGVRAEARSPIFPIVVGEPEAALALAERLRRRGILAKAIRPPTVPEGTSRLRIAVCAGHTEGQVDLLVSALQEAL